MSVRIFGLILLTTLSISLYADDFMEQTNSQCFDGTCFKSRGCKPSDAPDNRTIQPPVALVRVVNQYAKDGSVRQDKGSGSMIEEDGRQWIITAAHIFREGIGKVFVTTQRGDRIDAEVAIRNTLYDVVLLKLERRMNEQPIPLAKTPAIQGEPSVGWGFGPDGRLIGQRGTVTGYAATNKSQTHETLKTSGRAREGDSGGAILNENGELIGLLWGTDGQYTYSTYCGRLRKIIDELKPISSQKEPGVSAQDPGVSAPGCSPRQPAPIFQETPRESPKVKILQTALIEKTIFALGCTSPPSILLYYLLRGIVFNRVKKKIVKRKRKQTDLNDDYAKQLNDLYELSGHSTTADATLGRLYDRKLQDAEESSNGDLSNFAKLLRKQVADQFLRIHSANPNPTE